jgi:hypothetical protein
MWAKITGFENYAVSSFGRVKNLETGRVLKPSLTSYKKNGYKTVKLYRNGVFQSVLVHRLVATAFCPLVRGAEEVNHIDHNKLNNRATNLEWVTRQANAAAAKAYGAYIRRPA